MKKHSYITDDDKRWTACCECNRGGNGNAPDKCSCGWKHTEWNGLGCFSGTGIIGEIKKPKKKSSRSRSKARYQRYLEFCDCFDSFIDFCYWDADQAGKNQVRHKEK